MGTWTLIRAAAWLACSASLSAQTASFNWEYVGEASGWATIQPDGFHVQGPDGWAGCTQDGTARVQATTAQSGWVSAHFLFENLDTGFGWWISEDPIYEVNGAFTYLGPFEIFDVWEGDVSFHVPAGASFGVGVKSVDCLYGPSILDVTAFSFVPDTWSNLGGALAGSAGTPKLNGLGSLQPGAPWTLSLVDCAAQAPAWLVISSQNLSAAFKGGTLVPDPTPPAVILTAATSPAGRIVWTGNWPAGIPSDVPLVLQWWISDGSGAAGFAASNGLLAITP